MAFYTIGFHYHRVKYLCNIRYAENNVRGQWAQATLMDYVLSMRVSLSSHRNTYCFIMMRKCWGDEQQHPKSRVGALELKASYPTEHVFWSLSLDSAHWLGTQLPVQVAVCA